MLLAQSIVTVTIIIRSIIITSVSVGRLNHCKRMVLIRVWRRGRGGSFAIVVIMIVIVRWWRCDGGNGKRGRVNGGEVGTSATFQVFGSSARRVRGREKRVAKGAFEFDRFGEASVRVRDKNGFEMSPIPCTFTLDGLCSNS